MHLRFRTRNSLALALGLVAAVAHAGLDVPAYSSLPNAPYTVYLNFGGFSYNGQWAGRTPGTTPAYGNDGDASSFSASELKNIKEIWARTAEKYAMFNVNVTTVDPAASGLSDTQRQAYYDNTPKVMHTVIGGRGSWIGGGGYSYLGTTQNAYGNPSTLNGAKTNWVFSAQAPNNLQFVAEATAHENGHGLGVNHQSDLTTNPIQEYSAGDSAHDGQSSVAPIMGNSYSNTRGLWREGTLRSGANQDDVAVLLSNRDLELIPSNIGNSFATATALAINGSTVDSMLSQGVIKPANASNPDPLGIDKYTKDYFSFNTDGTEITLKLNAGAQRITAGVADPGATFDGYLNIYGSNGLLIAKGVRAGDTLSSTFTGTLTAGSYYAEITSYGGYFSNRERTAGYYTMGSYFLTGSGGFQAVPEPTTLVACGLSAVAFLRRRKRA